MISACIIAYSLSFGIDPEITKAVVKYESNYNSSAVGTLGEIGLMQIRPEYSKLSIKKLFDPCLNIREGVSILKRALKSCKHQADNTWVICYNLGIAGGSKVKYPKLFPYYKNVMAHYRGNI